MLSFNNLTFALTDYIVFVVMLIISTSIGLYFGLFAKSTNTTDEYLLGGKKMKILPVAVSIAASQLSPLSMLSLPAEYYSYGWNYLLVELSMFFCIPVLSYVIYPVFYDNNLFNCYEYVQLRFNKRTRQIVTATFVLNSILLLPVIIFMPSLALSQVSGINIHLINAVITSICVFYTMLGGLKAVVWTDVVQAGIMLTFVVLIGIFGTIKTGGFYQVFQNFYEGGRFNLNFSWDPRVRLTVWNSLLGGSITFVGCLGLNQSSVQRIISLPSLRHTRIALFLANAGFSVIMVLICFNGIVMYARYHGCDPMLTGWVNKADQLMPFFVQDVMGHFSGMPGLFISCVFSSALSPMAGILNSLAGVFYFDYIKPFIRHTEAKGNAIMKIFVVSLGVYSVLGGYLVQKFDSIVRLVTTIAGINWGAVVGVFTIGVLVPRVNAKVAILSMSTSLITMIWIIISANMKFQEGIMKYTPLPTTTDQCDANSFRNITNLYNENTTMSQILSKNLTTNLPLMTAAHDSDRDFSITEVSFYWYTTIGVSIFWLTAIPLSFVFRPGEEEKRNPKLFTPLVRKFLKEDIVHVEELLLKAEYHR